MQAYIVMYGNKNKTELRLLRVRAAAKLEATSQVFDRLVRWRQELGVQLDAMRSVRLDAAAEVEACDELLIGTAGDTSPKRPGPAAECGQDVHVCLPGEWENELTPFIGDWCGVANQGLGDIVAYFADPGDAEAFRELLIRRRVGQNQPEGV